MTVDLLLLVINIGFTWIISMDKRDKLNSMKQVPKLPITVS